MLPPSSYVPPKSGTSRFSKALSGVPSPTKPIPQIPSEAKDLPPPPPPPHVDVSSIKSISTPDISISSPPSPPPKLTSYPASPPTSASSQPQKMVIPRKAVGQIQPYSPVPPPEASPAISVSSILDAYARPYDSPLDSADGSQAGSWSASVYSPVAYSAAAYSPATSPGSQGKEFSSESALPPVPPKDDSTPTRAELPGSGMDPASSPDRSELWRRRPQNSLSGREISDLKLSSSHGSTVGAPSELMGSQPPVEAKPITRKPPGLGGLPGRNIRPGQTKDKPTPAPPTERDSLPSSQRPDSRPSTNRPPTPEYRKGDGRAPVVTPYAQPASPPKSPTKSSADIAKQLPPEPPKDDFKPPSATLPTRKPIGGPEPSISNDFNNTMGSNASLRKPVGLPKSASATSEESIVTARTSQSDTSSSEQQRTSAATSFQSRDGSMQPNNRRPMEQMRPPPSNDPRIVNSETDGPMYKGRDGTLYPEMKKTREADPRAFYFPAFKGQQLDRDAVIASVGLKQSHYNCFQEHKIMNRRTNRNHPIKCQTCEKADSLDRWSCSFCHLRICESCLQVFNSNQRSLTQLVNQVSQPAYGGL